MDNAVTGVRRLVARALALATLGLPVPAALPVATTGAAAAAAPAATMVVPARPHAIIFMISDGMGPASLGLARLAAGHPLTLDSLLVGACETSAADARVTDSAAAATALACGVKTKNACLGLDDAGRPVASLLEAARDRGLATGLVATSRITHATPAAFAAHELDRNSESDIARQMLDQHLDVMFGGGRRWFLPETAGGARNDRRDLLAESAARGVTIVDSPAGLARLDRLPAIGLFTADHMSFEIDRDPSEEPSLAGMTRRAIELLDRDPDGFFLMVEGSRIDHAAHDNDPAAMCRDILAYDAAVSVAREFARRDGRVLLLSVSDHETGGLTLSRIRDGRSLSDVRPEALARCRASDERMIGLIRGGAPPESVLAREAGLDSLGDVDRRLLAEGVAGRDERLCRNLGEIVSRRAMVGWATFGHTAVDVNLYAEGPGASELRGLHSNAGIGQIVARLMDWDLGALTARLRTGGAGP